MPHRALQIQSDRYNPTMEMSFEEVDRALRMPHLARAHDGTPFSIEWQGDEVTTEEILTSICYRIRGPLDSTPEYKWIAPWPQSMIAEPDVPLSLTALAEEALDRWLCDVD
jgi:hypothetical protein